MGFFDFRTKILGVDPGSQNLRIVYDGKIIFNETAEISMESATSKVSGYGNNTVYNDSHHIFKPLNNVITDFHAFEHLLRASIKGALEERSLITSSYIMYLSIPMTATEVEKRAYRDSAEHAGAKEVYLIHQSCSAAMGMNILFEKKNFVLIDFSASKMEITAFADSMPVAEGIIPMGTWKLKRVLKNYIFRNFKVTPMEAELENILTSLSGNKAMKNFQIQGKEIPNDELLELLNTYFTVIEDEVLEVIENASKHPAIDRIVANGIYITGGGSNIKWISERIGLNGKLPLTISSNGLLDNINGIKKVLSEPKQYKMYLMT